MCSSRLASYDLIFKLILLDNEEERFCTKTSTSNVFIAI